MIPSSIRRFVKAHPRVGLGRVCTAAGALTIIASIVAPIQRSFISPEHVTRMAERASLLKAMIQHPYLFLVGQSVIGLWAIRTGIFLYQRRPFALTMLKALVWFTIAAAILAGGMLI